jgi:dienelactone hydrolase
VDASPALAQANLGLPTQPEYEVRLPGARPQFGAHLYAPKGDGPFPAAVLSHTCAGLRQHVFEWAQRFVSAGYVALVVDHLGPRGRKYNCWPDFAVSVTEYAQDDVAAMKHLRSLPLVDGKRIVHMGFSYGAQAGLRLASEKFRAASVGNDRFSAIVSFYPWCNQQRGPALQDHQWNFYDDTTTPLLLLLGAEDSEADYSTCTAKAQENAAKGMPVEFKVFAGATHSFDSSILGDKGYEFWQGRGEWRTRIVYRYNREAVEESWRLALAFFARHGAGPNR